MYLSILASVCAWLSGYAACLGRARGDDELALLARWCGRGLLLSAVIFLAISFTVGCASSRTGKALNVGIVGAGVADVASTRDALARGAQEANPIMQGGLVRQTLVKSAGVGAVIGLAQLLEIKHPRLAHVLRGLVIVGWSVVTVHNVRVGR